MKSTENTNTRKAQALATRSKLLEAAEKLFAKGGYSATSVRDINREANLANGLLYHYFPGGKKEIFREIVRNRIEDVMKAIRTKNSSLDIDNTPIRDILISFFDELDAILSDNDALFKIIMRENEVVKLIDYNLIILILAENRAYIENLLKRKEELGEIEALDCSRATELLFALTANRIIYKGLEDCSVLFSSCEKRNDIVEYILKLWNCSNRKEI